MNCKFNIGTLKDLINDVLVFHQNQHSKFQLLPIYLKKHRQQLINFKII